MSDVKAIGVNFANQGYILEMLKLYLEAPGKLDREWVAFFQGMEFSGGEGKAAQPASNLEEAFRRYGHLLADFNPMILPPESCPELDFKDLDGEQKKEVERLRAIYCGPIGYECYNLENGQLERWFHEELKKPELEPKTEDYLFILEEIYKAKELENALQRRFLGAKRFSIEGAETFTPLLKEIFHCAGTAGYEGATIGMAHRGRINVLANIMGKSYAELFFEFSAKEVPPESYGMGDVKYHKGATAEIPTRSGKVLKVELASNPSHLESVDPVVVGITKARQRKLKTLNVLPILVHGDAAVAGQGVVYETLQLSKIKGYEVFGTIHIVINNQVGFTATVKETRSTRYCTDIAKTFGAPVLHVNGENPIACLKAARLAFAARDKFGVDVFIDLNCHRLWGHNEADEPMFTNPDMYRRIKEKDHIYKSYSQKLLSQGLVTQEQLSKLEKTFQDELTKAGKQADEMKFHEKKLETPMPALLETALSKEKLQSLLVKITAVPEGFQVHPKIQKVLETRKEGNAIDWAVGELLAYASLVEQGVHVRISGQDSVRGTFSHRHAKLIEQDRETLHSPLEYISEDQAPFDIYNSALSEYAVMGFEFGYSITYPKTLVIWEGQFGDFANGAQIVIDQYLAGCETKWGTHSPLTLFLPHGFEGMGSEHSSCRLERYLELSGLNNWRVCYPSTPAQMFHLLRNQGLSANPKPLILATPKAFLRYAPSFSKLEDLSTGKFQEILDDPTKPKNVRRLILCSGKIYHELVLKRGEKQDIAIIRIEELYPFDRQLLAKIMQPYHAKEIVWVQEEPENQGAWSYLQPQLAEIGKVRYIGRMRSSVPDTGFVTLYKEQQERILKEAIS